MTLACGEKIAYFLLAHSPHIGVPGIIDKEIVPNDMASRLQNPNHLTRYLTLGGHMENRAEHSELQHQIKPLIRETQQGGVADLEPCVSQSSLSSFCNHCRPEIDTEQVLWLRAPADELL